VPAIFKANAVAEIAPAQREIDVVAAPADSVPLAFGIF
jgi:hypothetical protein